MLAGIHRLFKVGWLAAYVVFPKGDVGSVQSRQVRINCSSSILSNGTIGRRHILLNPSLARIEADLTNLRVRKDRRPFSDCWESFVGLHVKSWMFQYKYHL